VVRLKPELFRVAIDTADASVSAPLPWHAGRRTPCGAGQTRTDRSGE
jgi:hypothetical protein